MQIFDVIKGEINNRTFVWKFPGEDFNTHSTLIVHETQEAAFFKDGQLTDIFQPGSYKLHTKNIPILKSSQKGQKNTKNKEKLSKEVIKMWQFILGVFVGANISLFLYAIILAGARSEKNNE